MTPAECVRAVSAAPAPVHRRTSAVRRCAARAIATQSKQETVLADPESPFNRLTFVGGIPTPQLNGRERQARLLGELAILNSRLAGNSIPAHEVRQKVEWVQRRRKNWQLVYDYIVKNDVSVTLEAIEAANAKVRVAGKAAAPRCAAPLVFRPKQTRYPNSMLPLAAGDRDAERGDIGVSECCRLDARFAQAAAGGEVSPG